LSSYPAIENHTWSALDSYKGYSDYAKKIRELLNLKDVLFIHPISNSVYARLKFAKTFGGRLNMLEAIDAKELYQLADIADQANSEEPILIIRKMADMLFNKTAINRWFNDKGLKRKTYQEDKDAVHPVNEYVQQLSIGCSFSSIAELLSLISKLPDFRKYRRDLFESIYWALKEADNERVSVKKAMENRRNKLRRVGRKVYGRCLGTTLLTKGLEFDNVVVLNAHEFKCSKHLYVALTRASKRLIVISENHIIRAQ
jgi:DNA helicase-2/ATP-dependent DNA helicase PcrA